MDALSRDAISVDVIMVGTWMLCGKGSTLCRVLKRNVRSEGETLISRPKPPLQ